MVGLVEVTAMFDTVTPHHFPPSPILPQHTHKIPIRKGALAFQRASYLTTGAVKPSPRASEGSAVRPRSRQLMPRLTLRMRDAVVTAIAVAELSANAAAIPAGIAAG